MERKNPNQGLKRKLVSVDNLQHGETQFSFVDNLDFD